MQKARVLDFDFLHYFPNSFVGLCRAKFYLGPFKLVGYDILCCHFCRLPEKFPEGSRIFVVDPMLATGINDALLAENSFFLFSIFSM